MPLDCHATHAVQSGIDNVAAAMSLNTARTHPRTPPSIMYWTKTPKLVDIAIPLSSTSSLIDGLPKATTESVQSIRLSLGSWRPSKSWNVNSRDCTWLIPATLAATNTSRSLGNGTGTSCKWMLSRPPQVFCEALMRSLKVQWILFLRLLKDLWG